MSNPDTKVSNDLNQSQQDDEELTAITTPPPAVAANTTEEPAGARDTTSTPASPGSVTAGGRNASQDDNSPLQNRQPSSGSSHFHVTHTKSKPKATGVTSDAPSDAPQHQTLGIGSRQTSAAFPRTASEQSMASPNASFRYGMADSVGGAAASHRPESYHERLMHEMERMEHLRGTSPTSHHHHPHALHHAGEAYGRHDLVAHNPVRRYDAFGDPISPKELSPTRGGGGAGQNDPYGHGAEMTSSHLPSGANSAAGGAGGGGAQSEGLFPMMPPQRTTSAVSIGGVSVGGEFFHEAGESATDSDHHHHEPQMPSRQSSVLTNASFISASVSDMPMHLQRIARQIRKLDHHDLLRIAEMTQRRTHRDVFSLLQYNGSAWYLPNIRPVDETQNEKRWEISYTLKKGAVISIAGRRMEFHPLSYCARALILVLLWFMLWTMLPSWLLEPGSTGYVFEPMVAIAVCSIVGGIICRILQLPPLIGVLWMGILWNNVPRADYLTTGIRPEIRSIASKMGLTLILVRAGFSLNLQVVKQMWQNTLSISFLPIACEAVTHGLIANAVFGYDNYTWSFLQAMVCSVVSAAVVVPGVLLLQSEGYGVGVGGPLNLALSGVGLDTVAGVWAVNFLLGILFDSTDLALAIALGPIQIIVGVISGIILGFLFHQAIEMFKNEADRMPNGKFSEAHLESVNQKAGLIFLAIGFAFVFLGYKVNLAGGGSTVTMVFAATTAHLWIKDGDNELMAQKQRLGVFLSSTWDLVVMPVLFTMVGTGVDLGLVFNSDFFPKAFLCWAAANVVRFVCAVACTAKMEMATSHRILLGLSWLGKAASQGAMGGLALERVDEALAGKTAAEIEQLKGAQEIANNIKSMSVLFIIFSAPIAAISIVKMGPRVLKKAQM